MPRHPAFTAVSHPARSRRRSTDVTVGADVRAWLMQVSSRWTVRYGEHLRFSGTDLPGPATVHVPTRHGDVRCLVHHARGDGLAPVYVHLHGGAFITRYPEMDDFFARIVVAEVGATVVSVDYDVAPQVRYPVAHDEAADVLAWVLDHADRIGGDRDRVVVGGFSAGGNLTASACLSLRDGGRTLPRGQLLVVPSLDVGEPEQAKRSPSAHPLVSPALLRLVRDTYFRDVGRRREPSASPLLAPSLEGLPPAMVVTAELDTLRAEGDAYARRLAEEGVPVRHRVVPRRDHYVMDGRADRAQARSVLDEIVAFLRDRSAASDGGPLDARSEV